ncbi:serine hydrolase domain-containing protein [Algimonas porphyrae]|nr:serine hydrolase domain-containing protein [Algimonas porphyrae]
MRKIALIFGLMTLWACGAEAVDPEAASTPAFDVSKTTAQLQDHCDADRFSGIVMVVDRDRTVYEYSCSGSAQTAAAINADTVFKLFSTSKQMTATIILQLVDEGQLSLDTPVDTFFEASPPGWNAVTVGDLLVHASGIPDLTNGLLEQFELGETDHAKAVQAAIKKAGPLAQTKGTGNWQYSNFGYEMLATIASDIIGADFGEIVATRVFDRAGMTTASVESIDPEATALQAIDNPRLIQGYNGEPGARTEALSYSFVQQGAGAVHASGNDLAAYFRALTDGRLLTEAARATQRTQTMPLNDTMTVIPGWFVGDIHGLEMLSHSGGNNGYISWFGMVPDRDLAIIMLSNYGDAPTRAIRTDLMDELFKADVSEDGVDQ